MLFAVAVFVSAQDNQRLKSSRFEERDPNLISCSPFVSCLQTNMSDSKCVDLTTDDLSDSDEEASSDPSSHEYERDSEYGRRRKRGKFDAMWIMLRQFEGSPGLQELKSTVGNCAFEIDVALSTNYGAILSHAANVILKHTIQPQRFKLGYTHRPYTRLDLKLKG